MRQEGSYFFLNAGLKSKKSTECEVIVLTISPPTKKNIANGVYDMDVIYMAN